MGLATTAAIALLSPVLVSGPVDGFGGCGVPTAQRSYEVEPSLAASPSGRTLLASWQQDRATRGATANVLAVSRDGGRSWRRTLVRGVGACGGGELQRASDPWSAVGPDGTLYVASLGATTFGDGRLVGSIVVTSSQDRGASFRSVTVDPPADGNDKEMIVADPERAGRAWVAWGRAGEHLVSRTEDHGRTWSAPVAIHEATGPAPDVQVLPAGGDRLVALYTSKQGLAGVTVRVARSEDAGRTWSAPEDVHSFSGEPASTVDGTPIRADGEIFSATAAGDGRLFATVREYDRERYTLRLLRSDDAGATWRTRRLVSGRRPRLIPMVAASPDARTIAVSYLDLGDDRRGDDRVSARYRLLRSTDGGDDFFEAPLTRRFDLGRARLDTEDGDVLFVGDYTGLAALGSRGRIGALVAVARPLRRRGPTDVVFTRTTRPGG